MGDRIRVTAAENAELTQSISKMKASLEEVKAALSSLNGQIDLLEGKSAKAINSVIEDKIQAMDKSLESWDSLQNNAQKIYEGIKETDEKLGS